MEVGFIKHTTINLTAISINSGPSKYGKSLNAENRRSATSQALSQRTAVKSKIRSGVNCGSPRYGHRRPSCVTQRCSFTVPTETETLTLRAAGTPVPRRYHRGPQFNYKFWIRFYCGSPRSCQSRYDRGSLR